MSILTFVEGQVLQDPVIPVCLHLLARAIGLLVQLHISVLDVLPPVLQVLQGDSQLWCL